MKKKLLISCGEMAKMHDINKKTLHYYDEIGLFHPYFRDEKGYRYYDFSQHSILEVILSLRQMDVSINEIKEYSSSRTPDSLIKLLKTNEASLKAKIKKLQRIKSLLTDKIKTIKNSKKADNITLVDCDEERLFVMTASHKMSDKELAEIIFCENQSLKGMGVYSYQWGTLMSIDDIKDKNFSAYDYVFIKLPHIKSSESLLIKPKGKYLQMYYKGDWDDFSEAYEKIISFADKHKFKLKGFAYEESIIDDLATRDPNEYVTKIQIAVEKVV